MLVPRLPAQVRDAHGTDVAVTGRSSVTAPPAQVRVESRGWQDVLAWAGPWPADTRWWDPVGRRRRARFQVVTSSGEAMLLSRENGSWYLDALYD